MNKKICIFTGARSDYGLLKPLMKLIQNDADLRMQIVASGMHLSNYYGETYKEILSDGFCIDREIETLVGSDTYVGVSKSMGIGLIGYAEAFRDLNPDLLVILGDRSEAFMAATAAYIAKIPIAHIHGGEVTGGAYDEAFRHSISKMASIHFVASDSYRQRVIQLGENPNSVFNVGSLGIDNIFNMKLLSRDEIEEKINFKFQHKILLITFHPETLEKKNSQDQINALLKVLETLKDTSLIFTMANSDTQGLLINEKLKEFAERNSNSRLFKSLGSLMYLSIMSLSNGVIGNSSSGIIEAPSLRVGTVNIGGRQRGRVMAESVISCDADDKSITSAILKLFSPSFLDIINRVESPFGRAGAASSILRGIKSFDFNKSEAKRFYDLSINTSGLEIKVDHA
ncbi:MAG: UDP-N-acetylglucosamine 2-epimerase [Polynucleobacter sp.]|nr:UDP-N-acetylglucosamine 2-epimerase [Polynucleobacter sp.]